MAKQKNRRSLLAIFWPDVADRDARQRLVCVGMSNLDHKRMRAYKQKSLILAARRPHVSNRSSGRRSKAAP